jgi:hypothetical protein
VPVVSSRLAAKPVAPELLPPLEAIEPRALEVEGESAMPFAAPGQFVIFDAGREGEVRDGDVVVAEVKAEMVLKRRLTTGDYRVYESLRPGEHERFPPIVVPLAKLGHEYPVVEVRGRPAWAGRSSGEGERRSPGGADAGRGGEP